jgi:hypothetical protein
MGYGQCKGNNYIRTGLTIPGYVLGSESATEDPL